MKNVYFSQSDDKIYIRAKTVRSAAGKRPPYRAKNEASTHFLCIYDKFEFFESEKSEVLAVGENLVLALWKTLWNLRKTRICKDFYPHCPQNCLWKTHVAPIFSVLTKKMGGENAFLEKSLLTEKWVFLSFGRFVSFLRIFEIFFVEKGDFLCYFSRKCASLT